MLAAERFAAVVVASTPATVSPRCWREYDSPKSSEGTRPERVRRYCARLCSTRSAATRRSRLLASATDTSSWSRGATMKSRQAVSAAGVWLALGELPGYCPATGRVGRSYGGISEQPAARNAPNASSGPRKTRWRYGFDGICAVWVGGLPRTTHEVYPLVTNRAAERDDCLLPTHFGTKLGAQTLART